MPQGYERKTPGEYGGMIDRALDERRRLRKAGLPGAPGRDQAVTEAAKAFTRAQVLNPDASVSTATFLRAGTYLEVVGTSSLNGNVVMNGTASVMGALSAAGGVKSLDARNRVLVTNYAPLYVDEAGQFGIAPSTLSTKSLHGKYVVDLAKWRKIDAWRYHYKDDHGGREMVSFLADLISDFPEFQLRAADGTLQGIRTEALIFGLHSAFVQYADQNDLRLSKQLRQTKTITMSGVSLAIGGVTTVDVVWDTAFADTDYSANASVTSAGVLASAIAAVVPGSKTATGCKVSIRSIGVALTSGQTLTVEGIHL